MIFRLSQKLSTKIKAGPLNAMTLGDNPYADWSCHLFSAAPAPYEILTNTTSLYSCVMDGKGITNGSVFIEHALSSLWEFMEGDGQEFVYQRFIAPASGTATFAKALNRSVTGSMNDHVQAIKFYLADDMAPSEIGFRLNKTPMSALIGADGRKYAHPRDAFKRLANQFVEGESGD